MAAYYNEHDEFAAAWLRNLIGANLIAPGDVDERSIEDVVPVELLKYTQCHFFAGIGVWSHSMRRAGWADDRRAWSGSCPCQPFSQAGEGAGFADERHLWPAFNHLIEQCGPDIVFGEQVASPDGFAWLDLVQSDMEVANYAFRALVTPAAGYGAPHIRHRTYWMAHHGARSQGRVGVLERGNQRVAGPHGLVGGVADGNGEPWRQGRTVNGRGIAGSGAEPWTGSWGSGNVGGVVHANGAGPLPGTHAGVHSGKESAGTRNVELERFGSNGRPGPVNGVWQDVDWLRCRDDKWRPVEPGTFPLVNGAPNRVGLLRGYGNAIVAPQAEEFIRVAMEYAP